MFFSHSYYSLRYGVMSPEQLVQRAKALGHDVLLLADINNSSAFPEFVKVCGEEGVTPVCGIDFRRGGRALWTGVARNNDGMQELNEFLSEHNIHGIALPERAPAFPNAYVVYPFGTIEPGELHENEYIGITPGDIRRNAFSMSRKVHERSLLRATATVSSLQEFEVHRNLRAVDLNTLITKLTPADMASPDEMLRSPDAHSACSRDVPWLLENTMKMLASCSVSIDFASIKNRKTFTGSHYDDKLLLEKLSMDGLKHRYGSSTRVARQRVLNELEIIDKLGFASYFLITWDIVRYSMARGFYHVGRGSGANSVVAYCLMITNVDPIELDLYFERFLNPRRSTPPDFDIDYSWKERDDVQDYIFKRYGHRHTALLGATSTFKDKSIYRELGKVYGLPKGEIDALVERPGDPANDSAITRRIINLVDQIADFPNIRSIHAGGIIVSEEPITRYTALDMPPKGFQTTQWDMYVAEDLGFEKFDILSQRGIGHIRDAALLVKENRGVTVDVHNIPMFKRDPAVRKQLMEGECNGCFYIESPAMRGLLKKLRCDDYISLVAASSIIRPGVAKSGMMKEYIRRFHNPEGFSYIHPVMEQQLKETYGVMVFQEDVLKICHHFAGLDLADADVLRRAMSGKGRGKKEFQLIVQKFFDNCKSFGYPDHITQEVWRQIESFAGYSFSKAHSASYAVESFQSLWLKVHYPLEFMVAVINNFGGFYRTWVYFNEARRWGATLALPCVNRSGYLTGIDGSTVHTGFIHVAGLAEKLAKRLVHEREAHGDYQSLEDFVQRVQPGPEQLTLLIRVGAFAFTGKQKAPLLWESRMLTGTKQPDVKSERLFPLTIRPFALPVLEYDPLEDAYDELELIGFPISVSWFDMLETNYRGEVAAHELAGRVGQEVRMLGKLVTIKYVWTSRKEIMHFAAFIDVHGEFFDTVHFPSSLKQYPFRGEGIYLLRGRVVEEFGFPSVEVARMAKMPLRGDPRGPR
jgi:DNA-directed DNA polymerase III PolC